MHRQDVLTDDEEVARLMDSPAGRHYASMLDHYGVGTGEQVAEYLAAFAEQAQADELMLLVRGPDTATNNRTLELVADAWGLNPDETAGDPTTWRR